MDIIKSVGMCQGEINEHNIITADEWKFRDAVPPHPHSRIFFCWKNITKIN